MTDMVSRSVGRLGSHHADAATSGPFIESSMNPRISSCVGSQRAGELIPPLIYAFCKRIRDAALYTIIHPFTFAA